ncbi:MAG: hypothetical protein HYU69_16695, partial [Bacteroidetes bacterium]|nr:hypothetical protein [Bacteroidota bacterium]
CDNTGNVYLTGYTTSPNTGNVIATAGGFQTVLGGGNDAFLVKFNPAGARIWGTYYGSVFNEFSMGGCLAIDANNNVYLYMEVEDPMGSLSDLDACAYQPNYAGGGEDQMIVKFDSDGKKLCATYFGGTGYEDLDLYGGGIAVSGNLLFVCASNTNGGYPVTAGAHQTVHSVIGFGGVNFDAVLACLCINICEGKTSLGLGFTAATSVCANTPVTFTPTISKSCDTTGYKYHWVFTNGTPATSDSMKPIVSFSGVGTHNVKLVVTTLCKKDSIKIDNYITTTQCTVCNLVGQFTKGTVNCTNCGCKEWVMVNATGGTNPYSYLWPDGYTGRYKNKLCAGTYTIIITDNNGCNATVTVNAP